MTMELFEFDGVEEWATDVAQRLAAALDSVLATGQVARVALPGGRSPAAILERLAAEPLPWERVVAMPTDERLAPDDHPA